jgi:opacity protein-like surface antigen
VLRKRIFVFVLLIAAGSAGFAAELVEPNKDGPVVQKQPPEKDWSFNLSLYGWATAIDGTISAGGRSADIGIDFSALRKRLDMAFMGAAELRYQRWGFMGDLIYARLSDDIAPPAGIIFSSTHEVVKETLGTFILSYRVVDAKPAFLDLFAGARVYSLYSEIVLRPNLGQRGVNANNTTTWADPIIGLRGRCYVSRAFFLSGYGDIGGFGAGSELSWQGFGGIGVQAARWCDLQLGYRALGFEYSSGNRKQEITTHGPIIGATFRF